MEAINSFVRQQFLSQTSPSEDDRDTHLSPFLRPTSCTAYNGRRMRRMGSCSSTPVSHVGGQTLRRSHSALHVRQPYACGNHGNYGSRSLPTTPRGADKDDESFFKHRRASSANLHSLQEHETKIPAADPGKTRDFEPHGVQQWTEYTARRSIVKFRNRRAAKRASLSHHGIREVTSLPSVAVHNLLQTEYAKCRNEETSWGDRLAAVLYCWYFGWIQDVYGSFTDSGTDRSYWKWFLACLLVTGAVVLSMGLLVMLLHLGVAFAAAFSHAALNFLLLVCTTLLLLMGLLTVASFRQ